MHNAITQRNAMETRTPCVCAIVALLRAAVMRVLVRCWRMREECAAVYGPLTQDEMGQYQGEQRRVGALFCGN